MPPPHHHMLPIWKWVVLLQHVVVVVGGGESDGDGTISWEKKRRRKKASLLYLFHQSRLFIQRTLEPITQTTMRIASVYSSTHNVSLLMYRPGRRRSTFWKPPQSNGNMWWLIEQSLPWSSRPISQKMWKFQQLLMKQWQCTESKLRGKLFPGFPLERSCQCDLTVMGS